MLVYWRRRWQPTPILPGQRSLAGYSSWGHKSWTRLWLNHHHHVSLWSCSKTRLLKAPFPKLTWPQNPLFGKGKRALDVSLHFTATGPKNQRKCWQSWPPCPQYPWFIISKPETERPGFENFMYHILAVLPLVNLYEIHFPVCKMGTIILNF